MLREGCHEMYCQVYDWGKSLSRLSIQLSNFPCRMETRRRSIIASLIVSSPSPTSARIGAVTAATCFLLAERTRGNARSVILLATPTVLILFPTSAACRWKPQVNCLSTGVPSTNFGEEKQVVRPVNSLSTSIPLLVPQILCQQQWQTSRSKAPNLLASLWTIVLRTLGCLLSRLIHLHHCLGRDLGQVEEFLLPLLISQGGLQRLQAMTNPLQVVPTHTNRNIRYELCPFAIRATFNSVL